MQPPQRLRASNAGIRKEDPPQDAAHSAGQVCFSPDEILLRVQAAALMLNKFINALRRRRRLLLYMLAVCPPLLALPCCMSMPDMAPLVHCPSFTMNVVDVSGHSAKCA